MLSEKQPTKIKMVQSVSQPFWLSQCGQCLDQESPGAPEHRKQTLDKVMNHLFLDSWGNLAWAARVRAGWPTWLQAGFWGLLLPQKTPCLHSPTPCLTRRLAAEGLGPMPLKQEGPDSERGLGHQTLRYHQVWGMVWNNNYSFMAHLPLLI